MKLLQRLFKRATKHPPAPPQDVQRARRQLDELELRLAAATIDRNGGLGNGKRRRR